ncbi:phage tail protein [Enterococcus sp. LJL90]
MWSGASGFISGIWNGIASTASSIWNGITSAISGAINQASSIVSSIVNGISSTISSVFGGIQSTVTGIWNGIKSAIEGPINTAKDIVKGAIDAIKGFFNFSISWPHIPMPHFGISPSGWSVGDLLKGSIPKLSIDWYANGGILTKPTVFGQNGNSLMVGGEAGKEAVAPLSDLMAYVEAAVANQLGKSEEKYNQMIYLLSQLVNKQTIIMMDSTPVGRLVTPTVMNEMNAKETMINKAWGRG